MFEQFIFVCMQCIAAIGAVMVVTNIAGASIYDIREVNHKKKYRLRSGTALHRRRPLITVIITAFNQEQVIEGCLSSLLSSSYRKVEIIVIDNASVDGTRQLVKAFMQRYPKRNIKLYARRVSTLSQADALLSAYKKYGTGELVIALSASDEIDKLALKNAVAHFNGRSGLAILIPKTNVDTTAHSTGLLQKYLELLSDTPKKLASVTNSEIAIAEQSMFKKDVFVTVMRATVKMPATQHSMLRPGNKNMMAYYGSDVVIRTASARSLYQFFKDRFQVQADRLESLYNRRHLFFSRRSEYSVFFTWFRLPFAACLGLVSLLIPVVLSYFIFLAVQLHEPTFLIISCGILAILLMFGIWGDDQLKFRQKTVYSLGIPITYGIFYLLSCLQYIVVLRALLPRKPAAV